MPGGQALVKECHVVIAAEAEQAAGDRVRVAVVEHQHPQMRVTVVVGRIPPRCRKVGGDLGSSAPA
jgi:hypothetical protein